MLQHGVVEKAYRTPGLRRKSVLGTGTELVQEGLSEDVTSELVRTPGPGKRQGFFICCHTRAFSVLII